MSRRTYEYAARRLDDGSERGLRDGEAHSEHDDGESGNDEMWFKPEKRGREGKCNNGTKKNPIREEICQGL